MAVIEKVDLNKVDWSGYKKHLADAVVVTKDNRLLLQRRPESWGAYAGVTNIFGGHVEEGETVIKALCRELNEELGAVVDEKDVVFIDAVTEEFTGHTELVHIHFWHDKKGTITGCYEAEIVSYPSLEQALAAPKLMDYTAWALKQCHERGHLRMLEKPAPAGLTKNAP